jgi:hypothetical protein
LYSSKGVQVAEQLEAGMRLSSAVCDTEVIVVRPPAEPVDLRCGGAPMGPVGGEHSGSPAAPHDTGTLVGKRYVLEGDDSLEVLCTKAGAGSLSVGTTPMVQKGAKPLPSSD